MHYVRIIFLLFSATLFASCGGGGGSPGSNPNQPNLVTTAGDVLTIPTGAFREYAVSGGVPPYQVSSSEPAIAVGNINGSTLSIGALTGGKATIRVFDFKGASVLTEVTVGSSIPLYTTAPSSINIGINVTRTFAVGGGAPPYTIVGNNGSVATVTQTDASHWSIVGVAANSSGSVKIRDSAGSSVDVSFSTTPPEMRISPDKLTMPVGMEAQVTVSGGQPPYHPAGGIPAAIQVTPATSNDGKFKIVGNLASKLDVTFVDTAGQSVKVEVEINTATVSFRLSPSPVSISENSTDDLTFSLFGFLGDVGTDASSGSVCLYISNPKYLTLDPARTVCSSFSSAMRTFKLVTGTRGNRCVSVDTPVQIQAVDAKGQTALGVVTIINNGTNCGGISTGLSVTPSSVLVQPGLSSDVVVRGGDGRYSAVSSNPNVVTVAVSGDIITVTGGTILNSATVTVTDADTGLSTNFNVTNGVAASALTLSPSSVVVQSGMPNDVTISGGSGAYVVSSGNPSIATAVVSASKVTITGGATTGSTDIRVTDTVTGLFSSINVTNSTTTGVLLASPATLFTTSGKVATVVVTGGSGRYGVSNVNTAIVETATVSGNTLSVTGGASTGTVNVMVYDVVTPSISIPVTVNNTASLIALPSSVTVKAAAGAGHTASVTVLNGVGVYSAVSGNTGLATVAPASGAGPFTITGVAVGTTTVNFVDTTSTPPRTVAVDVKVE